MQVQKTIKVKIGEIGKNKQERLDVNLAYILGVIGIGDGCISPYKRKWRITLNTIDEDFANKFKDTIKNYFRLEPKISIIKWKNGYSYFSVNIYSKEICNYILHFGDLKIFREKSERTPQIMIKNNDKKIFSSFLSGIWDSQGYVVKGGKNSWKIKLGKSNKEVILELKNLLKNIFDIESSLENKGFILTIGKYKDIKKFYDCIGFSIKRKQERLLNALKNKHRTFWAEEEIEYLINNKNKKTLKEISKDLGRSYQGIKFKNCAVNKSIMEPQAMIDRGVQKSILKGGCFSSQA